MIVSIGVINVELEYLHKTDSTSKDKDCKTCVFDIAEACSNV